MPETAKDFGPGGAGVVSKWLAQVELYDKEYKKWVEQAERIEKRYRDERATQSDIRKLNLLWSNIQILRPALYDRPPKPEIGRRFKDKDPIGRVASELLERATSISIEEEDFDEVMEAVVLDRLLGGRGVAWSRYEPTFGPEQGEGEESFSPVTSEAALVDYVAWKDFGHTPVPKWKQVTAVWRWVFMTRDELVKRFPKKGNEIPLNHSPTVFAGDEGKASIFSQARILEIWDKTKKEVTWISKEMPEEPIEVQDDFLKLTDFFPCPKPIYATLTNEKLVPVPDFKQYQDQAQEVDDLTVRISLLTEALRIAGVYDSSAEGIQQLLDRSQITENRLIPIENWAQLAGKGGLDGVMSLLPVKEVAEVLVGLYGAREQAKNDLFEVSGVSDIVRGQVDPREKLGQSQLKGQFATLRIEDSQKDVARFARDLVRMKAEIIAEHFSPETIKQMANMPEFLEQPELAAQSPEAIGAFQQEQAAFQQETQQAEQEVNRALALLRNDKIRGFRVDIETDSTIKPDREQDKQDRIEFLTAAGTFLSNTLPLAQASPDLIPVLGEMLLFGVRGFRAGRSLEDEFEGTVEKLKDAAGDGAGDGAADDAAAESALKQQEIQAKADLETRKLDLEERKNDSDASLKDREIRVKEGDLSASEFGRNEQRIAEAEQVAATVVQSLQQVAQQLVLLQQGVEGIRDVMASPKVLRDVQRRNGRIVGGVVEQGGVETPVTIQ